MKFALGLLTAIEASGKIVESSSSFSSFSSSVETGGKKHWEEKHSSQELVQEDDEVQRAQGRWGGSSNDDGKVGSMEDSFNAIRGEPEAQFKHIGDHPSATLQESVSNLGETTLKGMNADPKVSQFLSEHRVDGKKFPSLTAATEPSAPAAQ
jgi:hypothetical protein